MTCQENLPNTHFLWSSGSTESRIFAKCFTNWGRIETCFLHWIGDVVFVLVVGFVFFLGGGKIDDIIWYHTVFFGTSMHEQPRKQFDCANLKPFNTQMIFESFNCSLYKMSDTKWLISSVATCFHLFCHQSDVTSCTRKHHKTPAIPQEKGVSGFDPHALVRLMSFDLLAVPWNPLHHARPEARNCGIGVWPWPDQAKLELVQPNRFHNVAIVQKHQKNRSSSEKQRDQNTFAHARTRVSQNWVSQWLRLGCHCCLWILCLFHSVLRSGATAHRLSKPQDSAESLGAINQLAESAWGTKPAKHLMVSFRIPRTVRFFNQNLVISHRLQHLLAWIVSISMPSVGFDQHVHALIRGHFLEATTNSGGSMLVFSVLCPETTMSFQ